MGQKRHSFRWGSGPFAGAALPHANYAEQYEYPYKRTFEREEAHIAEIAWREKSL